MKLVCSKPTKSRDLEDVILIIRWMKEVATFAEFAPYMGEQELIVYCLCLRLRQLKPFEPLCRIGEAPYEVFYVLDGQIGVTSLNSEVYNAKILEDKVFHTEKKGATIGEASILYNSLR